MINNIYIKKLSSLHNIIIILNLLLLVILTYKFSTNPILTQYFDKNSLFIIISFNAILAIIAIFAIIFYNYLSKIRNLQMVKLYYFSLAVELTLKILIYNIKSDVRIFNETFFWTNCLKIILIGIVVMQDNEKIMQFIKFGFNKNTIIKLGIFSLITLTFLYFDMNNFYYSKIVINIIKQVFILEVIITIIAIIFTAARSLKENEPIWMIISLSLVFICIMCMYKTSALFMGIDTYYNELGIEIFTFLALLSIFMGMFVQSIRIILRLKDVQEELNIFFKMVDENTHDDIFITSGTKVIYMNKKARKDIQINENTKELFTKIKNDISNEPTSEGIFNFVNFNKQDMAFIVKSGDGRKYEVTYQSIKKLRTHKGEDCDINVYTCKDVTENIKKESLIEISKNKLSVLGNSIEEGVIVTDELYEVNYINNYFEKCLGYKDIKITGSYITDYIDIIHFKQKKERVVKFKDANGKNRTLNIKIEDIKDKNNKIMGYLIIFTDCAQKDKIEKLNTKMKKIQESDVMRKEYFTNLSHELRTPIHIMYSTIQLLDKQKGNLSSSDFARAYSRYSETMRKNTLVMLKLVNNLIDISKIDSGFIHIEKDMYDIVSLVEDITGFILPYVNTKDINLVFDTQLEERFISCDPEKIERIMLNLLSNAIKFTPEKGDIFVNLDFNDEWVEIRVRDTGCGIPVDLHEKIFERFVQNDRNIDSKKNGSGIGLSLVKALVDMHNGMISINKELTKGTEFIVKLPNSTNKENILSYLNRKEVNSDTLKNISVEFSDII